MMTRIRHEAAEFLFSTISSKFSLANLSQAALEAALEVPKKLEHGHLAWPVFSLAKELRMPPPKIAQEVCQALLESQSSSHPLWKQRAIQAIAPAGGFVNLTFSDAYMQAVLAGAVESKTKIGFSESGSGKKLVLDYVSPNVAKPMHIGHLRATVIGQALRNLAETQGYQVIGLNHLGDWGVQFGKLAWAYLEWGQDYDFVNKPFESLYAIYVRFHDEAEKNPEIEAKGASTFLKLEAGDPEITAIWKNFVEISLQEYGKVLGMLGVKHDLVRGESFYNDRLEHVEDLLEKKGLLVESEGAMVVPLGDEMPPCLIRKSDGASLYATRDIASAIFRHDELKSDLNLYCVGAEQSLHFKQVFKVLELMGFEWAKDCHHISFGMYRFKEGKMSTRKGRTVFLKDVIDQAVELMAKIIEEKNPALPNKELVARQVGVGAVLFNDLAVDRLRDVEFDWEKALSFEGDSGPYVQYTHVRCVSLAKKFAQPIGTKFSVELTSPEERELIRVLLNYQDVLSSAFATFKPSIVAQYLLEVCGAFSSFYNKHRILGEAPEIAASRMTLVETTRVVLAAGLGVLNIQAPEAM